MSESNQATLQITSEGHFVLQGVLSYHSVPKLWQQAKKVLTDRQVTVDLAGVEHSDSVGLALLTDWLRNAKACERQITFINPTPQMLAIANVCGLNKILGFSYG